MTGVDSVSAGVAPDRGPLSRVGIRDPSYRATALTRRIVQLEFAIAILLQEMAEPSQEANLRACHAARRMITSMFADGQQFIEHAEILPIDPVAGETVLPLPFVRLGQARREALEVTDSEPELRRLGPTLCLDAELSAQGVKDVYTISDNSLIVSLEVALDQAGPALRCRRLRRISPIRQPQTRPPKPKPTSMEFSPPIVH